MTKKVLVIVGVIVILFAGIILLTNYKNGKKLEQGNPYGTKNLHQKTIDLIGDELYGNIIVPDDLDKRLLDKETLTVYYFSPTCTYCIQTTPVVVPLTEEYGIDMYKMNLLEYDKMKYYNVQGTPTVVHYEEGVEVGRLYGAASEAEFRQFFEEVVLKK